MLLRYLFVFLPIVWHLHLIFVQMFLLQTPLPVVDTWALRFCRSGRENDIQHTDLLHIKKPRFMTFKSSCFSSLRPFCCLETEEVDILVSG